MRNFELCRRLSNKRGRNSNAERWNVIKKILTNSFKWTSAKNCYLKFEHQSVGGLRGHWKSCLNITSVRIAIPRTQTELQHRRLFFAGYFHDCFSAYRHYVCSRHTDRCSQTSQFLHGPCRGYTFQPSLVPFQFNLFYSNVSFFCSSIFFALYFFFIFQLKSLRDFSMRIC